MSAAEPRARTIEEELTQLISEGATPERLQESKGLIEAISPAVVPADAGASVREDALAAVLWRVTDVPSDEFGQRAEHLRAAREAFGWTEWSPEDIRQLLLAAKGDAALPEDMPLSKVERLDRHEFSVRQILAGGRFISSRSGAVRTIRGMRNKWPKMVAYVLGGIETLLQDAGSVQELAERFGGNGEPTGRYAQAPRRWLTRRTTYAALGLATLLIAVVVVIVAMSGESTPEPPASRTEAATPDQPPAAPAPPVHLAVVRHTEGVGLKTFVGPANTYPEGNDPPFYTEGDVIAVVCQERNGQPIHDPRGDPNRYKKPWPVWDKLSNGLWVSDLYTDLPKVPGDMPPDGIPRC
jgi:hypothetical protein